MEDSQSLRIPAASAAKVGMAAALAAGMAIATPTAAFAAGEDQDVSVASENASDSYYYIGDRLLRAEYLSFRSCCPRVHQNTRGNQLYRQGHGNHSFVYH